MGWNWHNNNDYDFDKDLNIDVKLDYDLDVKVDKDVDVNIDVKSDVDLDGNYAEITFDAEAIGDNTLTEGDFFVLVIDNELSSISGTIIAAAD